MLVALACGGLACSPSGAEPTPPVRAASPCTGDGGWASGWKGCVEFVGRLVDRAGVAVPLPGVEIRGTNAAAFPDSIASDSTGRFFARVRVFSFDPSDPPPSYEFFVHYARSSSALIEPRREWSDSVLVRALVLPPPELHYRYDVGTRRAP